MHSAEKMSFVAVDFETANQTRASVCQTGVAVVRNGVVEDVQEWFVQPPTGPDSFHPINVKLHRITPSMAATGMQWGESAERLKCLVGDLPVIAHNAEFDRSVYLGACEALNLSPIAWKWYCSLGISQNHLPLSSHTLDKVAAHLGVDIGDHHRAGSDARVAAEILLAISRASGRPGLDDLGLELPAPRRSRNRPPSHPATSSFIPAHTMTRYTRVSDLPKPNQDADPQHPLHGEYVVLSGEIGKHDRDHWFDRLATVGAQPQLNITKKTTLVAVGSQAGRGKTTDAEKRRAAGQSIRTISGERLMHLLEEVQQLEVSEYLSAPDVVPHAGVAAETHTSPVEDPGTTRHKPLPNDQRDPILETPSPRQPKSETPIEPLSPAPLTSGRDYDSKTFQHWDGPPGSLPEGWTLAMQHRGRPRRITTAQLNRDPTGALKRVGAAVGIILGSFVAALLLTPLLGPVAPLLLVGGMVYGTVFPIKSARADRLRWQYWANRPEPRQVLLAHSRRGAQ